MYNIPTQVNNNYQPKKKNFLVHILVLIISIILVSIGIRYIKVFNTHGHSMQPTINDDSFVICIKTKEINPGDIVAFYSGGSPKIKRVIALAGDTISIDNTGAVRINDKVLKEDYLNNTVNGESEITFPHTVENSSVFVLGDNRGNSIDSRHFQIGDVSLDDIICEVKLVL